MRGNTADWIWGVYLYAREYSRWVWDRLPVPSGIQQLAGSAEKNHIRIFLQYYELDFSVIIMYTPSKNLEI